MVKMFRLCDGIYIPRECCAFTAPQATGGESVVEKIDMPCGDGCDRACEGCIIQGIFNDYAERTGQAAASLEGERGNAAGGMPAMRVKVKMKGYKKAMKKIRQMEQEARKASREMERAAKMGKSMFGKNQNGSEEVRISQRKSE